MKTYDLHQDLLLHVRHGTKLQQVPQTSWSELEHSSIDLLFATAFPYLADNDQTHDSAPSLITEELGLYKKYIQEHDDVWQLVESVDDVDSHKKKILLHVEGLNTFDGSPAAWEQLLEWQALGLRSVGTHWNIANQLGGGTLQPEVSLTNLGYELIEFLEQEQLIFDLAHMSRRSFTDAAGVATRPLFVSHGNAAALCDHVRNYTDEQLVQIAESGGVIGIFFSQAFTTGKDMASTVNDVVEHISYIRDLIGIEHVGIGSDWGGITTGNIPGLTSVTDLPHVFSALEDAGYSEKDIECIAYKNAERVIRDHLGT